MLDWQLDKGMVDPHGIFCFLADLYTYRDTHKMLLAQQHVHGFHELFFFRSGDNAVQFCRGKRYPLRPGDLYILPAGLWHIAGSETAATAYVLNFYTQSLSASHSGDRACLDILRRLVARSDRQKWRLPLGDRAKEKAAAIFATTAEECARQESGWQTAMHAGFTSLLLLLSRETELAEAKAAPQQPVAPDDSKQMERVLSHIHEHFRDDLTVAQMATLAAMSRSKFHATFKAHAGMPLTKYVNRLRVIHATKLLRRTERTLFDVASESGFRSLSHFHAVFKQHTGSSPGTMRGANG